MKYITYLCAALLTIALYSCSDETLNHPEQSAEGTLLNLYVGDIGMPSTRLAELGGPGDISGGQSPSQGADKKDIGLYIYYQDDYSAGNLTKPYVRNLRCKVEGGKVVPMDNSSIYIYDRMTIVAFYPYNGDADDYTFTTKNDEKKYSISESDYSYQYYIPYRAQANVNPTTAFYVNLNLNPVQTTKIQVVLVASNPDHFPGITTRTDGVVKLVPDIDPVSAGSGDKRENWVDIPEQSFPGPAPASSGQYVRRYTSYIWKNNNAGDPQHGGQTNHHDNTIKKGEILLQSDNLTLFFPEDIEIREGYIYRYGYNIETGELFIPTSETLIYDATTLRAAGGGGYQVCDIDLTGLDWMPVDLVGTYDGGGHAVKNMTIAKNITGDQNIGLFGSVSGNSLIKNLDLQSPTINIDFSGAAATDVLNVGTLVGQLNKALTEEQIAEILRNQTLSLPDGLPQSVIEALIADMMKDFTGSSTSQIQGCRVSEPVITVKGENVIAGGLTGSVGDGKDYKGEIKDSYVLGGTINVNTDEDSKKLYEHVRAGAFAGSLKNGSITNSYTTASAEAYVKEEAGTPSDPVITSKEVAKGFTNIETPSDPSIIVKVQNSYTEDLKDNFEDGVSEFGLSWPAWGTYGGNWPVVASTVSNYWGSEGSSPSTYPTLMWETRLDVKK
jgi:hypothetical protein